MSASALPPTMTDCVTRALSCASMLALVEQADLRDLHFLRELADARLQRGARRRGALREAPLHGLQAAGAAQIDDGAALRDARAHGFGERSDARSCAGTLLTASRSCCTSPSTRPMARVYSAANGSSPVST